MHLNPGSFEQQVMYLTTIPHRSRPLGRLAVTSVCGDTPAVRDKVVNHVWHQTLIRHIAVLGRTSYNPPYIEYLNACHSSIEIQILLLSIGNNFLLSLVGWLVVLRIYVALAIFQPYRDLVAWDNQSLKFKWRGGESSPGPIAFYWKYSLLMCCKEKRASRKRDVHFSNRYFWPKFLFQCSQPKQFAL